MRVFNINDYDFATVMHCKSMEEATAFTEYLDSIGMTWACGDSYINRTLWCGSRGGTCYRFVGGNHGSLDFYKNDAKSILGKDAHILEYSDFDWVNANDVQTFDEISYDEIMMFGE